MPAYTKTILCLANSRKLGGRCVAGREVNDDGVGPWIRPVSNHGHGEVSEADRRFQNGIDPVVLDIIEIPMLRPKPHLHQLENHLIDHRQHWRLVGKATPDQIRTALQNDAGPLWSNTSQTRHGLRDRVDPNDYRRSGGSLRLISVDDLEVQVTTEGAQFNNPKRKVRGQFTFRGTVYRLSVTDPVIERRVLPKEDNRYRVGRAYLCISLGDVNERDGLAYKLIAAVIAP